MRRWCLKLVLLFLTVVFMHGTAQAAVAVHKSFPVSVEVFSDTSALNSLQKLRILIAFDIASEWHILSSEDKNIGAPTSIRWTLPGGYQILSERWSREQEFPSEFGVQYGYSDKAFYLAEILPDENYLLKADFVVDVSWQACSDECQRESVPLSFSLPISETNVLPTAEWSSVIKKTTPYFEVKPVLLEPFPDVSSFSLVFILFMAFVGGLLLNLMPCVLPILSLKIFSLLKTSEKKLHARREALAYFCGVMVSFLIMSALLFILRKSGEAVGWGFQLQSPWFVCVLIIVFLVLTLLFLDVFTFNISFLKNKSFSSDGCWGAFLTGIFAVLAASSCSAPFMGAAVGYTLMQPFYVCLLVFVCLGFGYAFPFTLAVFFPTLLSLILPRPGKWMIILKRVFAVPMLLTCLWLGGVLYVQLREKPILPSGWKSYHSEEISKHIYQNDFVFIDFSAQWCLTCLANEKFVLDTPEFLAFAKSHNIQLYRADWTNNDPDVTKALASFGRNSVPLYVFYSYGKPILLPQIFTSNPLIPYFSAKK